MKKQKTRYSFVAQCIMGCCALGIAFCLLRWKGNAPSILYNNSRMSVGFFSYTGASISAILHYVFGVGSYMVPLALGYWAHIITFSPVRLISLVALPVGVGSIWALVVGTTPAAGKIGIVLAAWLRSYMSMPLAVLIVLSIWAIAITLATQAACWSWVSMSIQWCSYALRHEYIHRYVVRPMSYCLNAVGQKMGSTVQWLGQFATGKLIQNNPALVIHELELEKLQHFLAQLENAKRTEQQITPAASAPLSRSEEIDDSQQIIAGWKLPSIASLMIGRQQQQQQTINQAELIEQKLFRFGIKGTVTAMHVGPVITTYQYQPDPDTKLSKISALSDDLALALQALSVRIIAPIPGTNVVGIEVPNKVRNEVLLGSILTAKTEAHSMQLPIALGVDTCGNPLLFDLARAPHMLIAGSTGSGKSVCLNTLLVSLIAARNPQELRLVLIDPKRLELCSYTNIPHLLQPIINEPTHAVQVLQWIVSIMEERYELLAQAGVRDIIQYRQTGQEMPYIVVVIDELADLMMTASASIETSIARIAQMARAAGIHLIVATQRPSVDVITGVIKVNFPTRIAFRVTSKVDSRTILDAIGAEQLLGRGDMLLMTATSATIQRAHGAYVSDTEIQTMANHWREQGVPQYTPLTQQATEVDAGGDSDLMPQVDSILQELDEISISLLQRRLKIGFNRSARIIELLERQGKVAPFDGGKGRKVLRS